MPILAKLFSFKLIILYTYFFSSLYVHYRGQVRFPFFRQLTDHSTLMAPINFFIYLFSSVPNKPYIDAAAFPELKLLKENWKVLQAEAEQLVKKGYIKASDTYDDIGFNSFFRTGWKRFYLKWYDASLPSAKELCPTTISLIEKIPSINAAMFALLPKDGKLVRHRDPYAGALRYHLGLITPNSDKCRIYVDGIEYYWKDGEEVMFDETYIHYAFNESEHDRIILFCDIKRPMRNRIADKANVLFSKYVMSATATRNAATDKVGFINKIFKYLYSIRLVGKRLKKYNRTLYYSVKYALLLLLLGLVFFVV